MFESMVDGSLRWLVRVFKYKRLLKIHVQNIQGPKKKKKKRFSLIKDGHLEILKMILNVIG